MRSVLLFIFLVRCAHLNRGAFLLGCIISTYSCALGSNSHRFSVVGDGYPRNSQVLYTHEKDSLLKVGCPSPIQGVWTVARKIFIYIYIFIYCKYIFMWRVPAIPAISQLGNFGSLPRGVSLRADESTLWSSGEFSNHPETQYVLMTFPHPEI